MLIAWALACQNPREAQELSDLRVERVEGGLLPAVVVEGRPVKSFDIHERMEHYNVPGVSVAVFDDYRIVWARGYGQADRRGDRPVTPSTLFQAASISKPVAAVAALKLVEEGRLALEGDVNRWLTSWKVPANELTRKHPVSLRGLLTHSAGLTVHGFPGYERQAPLPSLQQILDGKPPANTEPVRVDQEPDSKWRYSGGGYTVMQQLLIDVTGKQFPQLTQAMVLAPLGMRDSTYEQPLPRSRWEQAAQGYRSDGQEVPGGWHVYPEMAAAGLWTTPSDLARFAIEIQRALRGDRHPVLSRETVERMLTPGLNGWGLGLALSGEGPAARFGHGGSNEGFRCLLVAYRQGGKGAAVMTNADSGGALAQELLLGIAREYGWSGLEPTRKSLAHLTSQQLARYAGRYRLPDGTSALLRVAGEGLRVDKPLEVKLYPESEEHFFSLDGLEVRFSLDGQRVTGFSAGGLRGVKVE